MKIAILILLHEYNEQQKKLIRNLSKDFDIYVHIDKRTNINETDVADKNVYAYKKYNVYWGNYTQILATFFLFKTAANGKYDRYIFISGADLPLKTNSEIKSFFANNNKEYFDFCKLPNSKWADENGGFDRIDYIHVRQINRGKTWLFTKFFIKLINKINIKCIIPLMRKLGIRRKRLNGVDYYGGANWMDLTNNCVSQIITFAETHKKFVKKFRHTKCADEIFFQTIILNYVKNIDVDNKCLRYIDWYSGPDYPRIMRIEDYPKLKKSDCLFARKFNTSVDSAIVDMICKDVECF